MNKKNRFAAPLAIVATLAMPVLTNGCSSDPTDIGKSLCCTDFKVGADLSDVDFGVDASIKGQFNAFAQASADLSGAVSGALEDVSGACKAIAQAGGANADKDDTQPAEPSERVTFWCNLASARIDGAFKVSGGASAALDIQITGGECKASFKAEANCQANCSVSGGCDVKANPPTCEGGKLEISCSGGCTGEAGASIECEGSCSGTCDGACTAEGGVAVDCEGKCDGTCAAGGSASGSGVQADGSCKGTCQGTCTASATAPKVQCKGTCKGSCSASCQAKAGASVKCDGKCDGSFQPLSCKGGELKAKCDVDANCSANCKASASAKAECTPPRVEIALKANAQVDAEGAIVIDALRANLPQLLLVVKARGQAFADLTAKVSASGSATLSGAASGKLGVKGTACLGAIVPVIVEAAKNAGATVKAAGSITAKVGG